MADKRKAEEYFKEHIVPLMDPAVAQAIRSIDTEFFADLANFSEEHQIQ
jgi:hypothetical protein